MTRVCLVGADDVNVRYELLSRETAREALATYQPGEPYENTLAVETVSLGAAVALLNDLDWYLTRFVDAALVREPSIDPEEWLSRDLATAVRNGDVDPEDTGDLLMVYGVDDGELVEPMYLRRSGGPGASDARADADADAESDQPDHAPDPDPVTPGTPSVEGSGVDADGDEDEGGDGSVDPDDEGARGSGAGDADESGDADAGRTHPDYDLREVEETLVVRVTEAEFAG